MARFLENEQLGLDRYPLTYTQRGLLLLDQIAHGSDAAYNVAVALRLDGPLEQAVIKSAAERVCARHSALRTFFAYDSDGEPVQMVSPEPSLDWRFFKSDGGRFEETLATLVREPFDLWRPPLVRLDLVALGDNEHVLLVRLHHIIADGWSLWNFMEELSAFYNIDLGGEESVSAVGMQFPQFALQQHSEVAVGAFDNALDFWRTKLDHLASFDILKRNVNRPRQTEKAEKIYFSVPMAGLDEACRLHHVTPFMIAIGALFCAIHNTDSIRDMIIGTPVSGRASTASERAIGCFINPVLLRFNMSQEYCVGDFLTAIRTSILEALDHSEVPFQLVLDETRIRGSGTRSPLQVMFSMQNLRTDNAISFRGLTTQRIELPTTGVKFDVNISLTHDFRGLTGYVEYNEAAFSEAKMRSVVGQLIDDFRYLIQASAQDRLPFSIEHRQLSQLVSASSYEIDRYHTLADAFVEQAHRCPDAVALVEESRAYSYRELNDWSSCIANGLSRQSVGPGALVGVCLPRSAELVAATYAIAKLGAAYVPLDPFLPSEQLRQLIQNSSARVIIVSKLTCLGVEEFHREVHDIESLASFPTDFNLPEEMPRGLIAYVMYTSGTTGEPKGVQFPVDAALTSILSMQALCPVVAGDHHLFKTPYAFDVSLWEVFWPLYFGGTLVVCEHHSHNDPRYVRDAIEEYNVTAVNFVPSMLHLFLDEVDEANCRSLKWVLCGGEKMTPGLVEKFQSLLPAKLFNLGGPTETHAVAGMAVKGPYDEIIPLGGPIGEFRLYILDGNLELLPCGEVGELYVGGRVGLAHGYHARPELTAAAFLPDPFGPPGSRMYKTGDYGQVRSGNLELLGRRDRQVKIGGVRVELDAIETVIERVAGVVRCHVTYENSAETPRLIAFVVLSNSQVLGSAQLRAVLRNELPRHMLPSRLVEVADIPVTRNGKVDFRVLIAALKDDEQKRSADVGFSPSVTEVRLIRIFETVLDQTVSVRDSFFDLGGSSLTVFRLLAAVEAEFGKVVELRDVFSSPSVRELGVKIDDRKPKAIDDLLIRICEGQRGLIVVLIHGAGGSLLPFVPVAQHLSGRATVYGLQSSIFNSELSIVALAHKYSKLLLPIVDSQRVVLVGWSFGGAVAFELGRKLREAGISPSIVMLDTWLISDCDKTDLEAFISEEMSLLGTPGNDELPGLGEVRACLRQHVQRLFEYTPTKGGERVRLILASEPPPGAVGTIRAAHDEAQATWARYSAVTAERVRGNHHTILEGDQAKLLADLIINSTENSNVEDREHGDQIGSPKERDLRS